MTAAQRKAKESNMTVLDGGKSKKKTPLKADGTPDKRRKENGAVGHKPTDVESEVYPLTQDEIKSIMEKFEIKIMCAQTPTNELVARRNLMMFKACINIGLRASDFTKLKWSDLFDKNWNYLDKQHIFPEKTKNRKKKKKVSVMYNDAFKDAIDEYLPYLRKISDDLYKDKITLDDYIFFSKKKEHIGTHHVWEVLSNTAKECGIEKNIGSHSIRKTFGRFHYRNAENQGEALVNLMVCFKHESLQTTKDYIGITDDELMKFYHSVNIGTKEKYGELKG